MNANLKYRTIHTAMFGSIAKDILSALHGQLSDGYWENSRGYDKYWTNYDVVQLPNGEVVFNVSTDTYNAWCKYTPNPFLNMSDVEFKRWIAGKLKFIAQVEIKDKGMNTKDEWRRDNTAFKSSYLDHSDVVTMADIYCVYDKLLDRQCRSNEDVVKRVVGCMRSESETEADRQAKIAEAMVAYNCRIAELKALEKAERKQITKKYADLRSKAYAEFRQVRDKFNA